MHKRLAPPAEQKSGRQYITFHTACIQHILPSCVICVSLPSPKVLTTPCSLVQDSIRQSQHIPF